MLFQRADQAARITGKVLQYRRRKAQYVEAHPIVRAQSPQDLQDGLPAPNLVLDVTVHHVEDNQHRPAGVSFTRGSYNFV